MPTEPFLERLMNMYGNTLLRMCYLYLKDYQLAEDAVQDTFIKAMKAYQSFQHNSSEKTWLTRIAVNCCKNVMRNRWFHIRQNTLDDHAEKVSDDPIENIVEKNSISAAIMALNAGDRQIIDFELRQLKLTDQIKSTIRNNAIICRPNPVWRSLAASLVIAILGGGTVFAGYQILNKIYVNEEQLPALDSMQIVQINAIDAAPDEYGLIDKDYGDYNAIKHDLGIPLIDTNLSDHNPYMMCHIKTDAKDFAITTVDNYLLGDTDNYQFIEAENRYSYYHGTEYFSPVSLTADLILSETQMNNGWDTDYLGLYEFIESYTSEQGYLVNIVQDTTIEKDLENYISEKAAIFVADGIRYTLKGRVSIDVIKDIISTMKIE